MDPFQTAALQRAQAALSLASGNDHNNAPGFVAGRLLKSLAIAGPQAAEFVDSTAWLDRSRIKAAIGAITIGDVGNGDLRAAMSDFADLVRPLSVLGRLPGLVMRPFKQKTLTRVAGSAAGFFQDGDAIPVSGLRFQPHRALAEHFVGALDVATIEALNGTDALDRFVGISLAADVAAAIDRAMLDPSNDGSGNAPRAITHADTNGGAIVLASTGDPKADFEALIAAYGGSWASPALILHPIAAAQLAFTANDWGDTNIGIAGGRILGIPAVCSDAVSLDTNGGSYITLLDVAGLAAALEVRTLEIAREASIELSTTPAGSSAAPTQTELVSLWQAGAVGMLATAVTDWRMRRDGGVVCLTGASYGGTP